VSGSARLDLVLLVAGLVLLTAGLGISQAAAAADDLRTLVLELAIIVTAAMLGGDVARRIGQPPVLGEVLAGILLGNVPGLERLHVLGADPYIDILARIGMLLLLFEVGLDLSVRDFLVVGVSPIVVALIGTAASIALGSGAAVLMLPGAPIAAHLFFGAAISATSVGITARVLQDMGASRAGEAKVIIGAAIVDDVLALVVLSILTGWIAAGQSGESLGAVPVMALVAKSLGFLTVAIVLGVRLAPAWFRNAARLRTKGALLAVGLCFCFFLSWAAGAIGLAPLVGAFAAGLVLEETHFEVFAQRGEPTLGELVRPITSFLVPVFFVLVGFRTNVRPLAHPSMLGFPLVLTLAAVAGKFCCAFGVLVPGARKVTVAAGMIPRGEVTLVFAALGAALQLQGGPLLDERGYTAIVAVVILTTLLTPPLLKWSINSTAG
jgi:Kef-type K+ transport system membrane component KefB